MSRISRFLPTLFFICSLSPALAGEVSRAQFTSDVIDREPVDRIEQLDAPATRVMFFTDLRGLEGTNVNHQWVYNDRVMFEKTFAIGGHRWRVWSSKTLRPDWAGIWYVHTLDENGNRLNTSNFTYH